MFLLIALRLQINGDVTYEVSNISELVATHPEIADTTKVIRVCDGEAPVSYTVFPYLEELVIPKQSFRGTLPDNMFNRNTYIKSVSCEGATEVGDYAFQGCSALTHIHLPSVVSIGIYAFHKCVQLVSVYFPVLFSLGRKAFRECAMLMAVDMPVLAILSPEAFRECIALTTVHLPNVIHMPNSDSALTHGAMFMKDSSLKTVTLNSTEMIPSYCFSESGVETVIIPMVRVIYQYAFNKCQYLKRLVLPNVVDVRTGGFYMCSRLEEVSMEHLTCIGDSAFYGCSELVSFYGPCVEKLVGDRQFAYCTRLELVSLSALRTVSPDAANIFEGDVKFTIWELPAVPPSTFNKNVIVNRGEGAAELVLRIPETSIQAYDDDVTIEGSQKGDNKWMDVVLVRKGHTTQHPMQTSDVKETHVPHVTEIHTETTYVKDTESYGVESSYMIESLPETETTYVKDPTSHEVESSYMIEMSSDVHERETSHVEKTESIKDTKPCHSTKSNERDIITAIHSISASVTTSDSDDSEIDMVMRAWVYGASACIVVVIVVATIIAHVYCHYNGFSETHGPIVYSCH